MVQKAPRVTDAHLGFGKFSVCFDVKSVVDLNRVARWMSLRSPLDEQNAFTACEVACRKQRCAVREVNDGHGDGRNDGIMLGWCRLHGSESVER